MLREFKQGRIFAGRLNYNDDLLKSIENICITNNIECATVSAIGAALNLKCGYYDIENQKYAYLDELIPEFPLEITSLLGNVSIKDGKPFCHLHINVSDRNGQSYGGHLVDGVRVLACEYTIVELLGDNFVRHFDQETGLNLW